MAEGAMTSRAAARATPRGDTSMDVLRKSAGAQSICDRTLTQGRYHGFAIRAKGLARWVAFGAGCRARFLWSFTLILWATRLAPPATYHRPCCPERNDSPPTIALQPGI